MNIPDIDIYMGSLGEVASAKLLTVKTYIKLVEADVKHVYHKYQGDQENSQRSTLFISAANGLG